MASSNELYCGICEGRKTCTKAIRYCPECEDALCNTCLEHHGISKATKSHSSIPAEDYKNLPSFILEIKTCCVEHNEKYQNYCISHQCPLCKKCIVANHKDCKEIAILDDVIRNAKTSIDIENITANLEETAGNIHKIRADKEGNLKKVEQRQQDINNVIENTFQSMIKHFEKLRKECLSYLNDEAKKHETCLQSFLNDLKERELKVEHLRESVAKMKMYASDLQVFLGKKRVEELIQQERKFIDDILAEGSLDHVNLLYIPDNDVIDITSRIVSFGQISTEKKPSSLTISNRSERQAQITSNKRKIDRHKETSYNEYNEETSTYRALYGYQAKSEDELTFKEGDVLQIEDKSDPDWWYGRKVDFRNYTDFHGYIPNNYIQKEDPLFSYPWYIGQASEEEKEKLLSRVENINKIGSFLISKSKSVDDTYMYQLSVLYINKRKGEHAVHHYTMTRMDTGFKIYDGNTSIVIGQNFLSDVVAHLSRDACGLCQRLIEPCQQEMEDWEVQEDSLDLDKILHNGKFSVLWKGRWNKAVAVTVSSFDSDEDSMNYFSSAMNTLKQCRHEHILKMYGVCTTARLIITELIPKGNLLKFLRGADKTSVKFPALVRTAAQIAEGMAYLELKSIIHKDLKAGNVLLTENHEAKICGFQLSQTLKTDDYDAKKGEKYLVKWSSPEVILYKKFSIKSDVWSYGILLYEMFTYGKNPYEGIINRDIVQKLQSGYRNPKPDMCPDSMYNIMKNCWNKDPASRPTFEFLFSLMDDYFVSTEPYYEEIDD